MSLGKFINKKFKNKEIEILIQSDSEWVSYSEADIINKMVLHVIVIDYDKECDVLTLKSLDEETTFYLDATHALMCWESGNNIMNSTKSLINTGTKLYKKYKKSRDIM